MGAQTLAVLVAAVIVAALARRHNLSSPLLLVIVGLAGGLIPGVPMITLEPDLVLFVLLPPLLWSAGLESSSVNLRRNKHSIGMLAVGLPLVTTFAVGVVAYELVPDLTLAAALTLGAIVAPPDAVSATAIGRRLGLPRRMMTLLGGESLLNDATALTAYKVALAAAIGTATSWDRALGTFVLAVVGGVLVGVVLGRAIDMARSRLDDPLAESALGLVAPFLIYLIAEELHGSGVLAVVAAALVVGQRSTHAGYATRLQDDAVWKALQLLLESFAFLLIGLQLPKVISELAGISAATLLVASLGVLATVIVVRIVWVFLCGYVLVRRSTRPRASHVFVVAWAGMRGVVSLAAAFAVPLTTLSGDVFPGRPQLVFLTFVVVIGTLLLHGLTLPWLIRALGVQSDEARTDALAATAAQARASAAAAERLDQLIEEQRRSGEWSELNERAAEVLRRWNTARGRGQEHLDEQPAAVFRRLRLEMLAAERAALIRERDEDRIDDEVLRTLLHGLDLEEATLNRQ
ncbi:Na+/H+ antiporter [Mycobacterium sp. MS1601]|uniref:Na+/H+ antiporter n=1 Tax=Mycobacterium sp. MS1601 TaxID=1936029 RepID=UPI00097928A6|nr:Na+/H+ antiporter [Mycobacterium sp. MS1601]AQA03816.1 Na+/H+ antiporter [Mycobacterium sp. MS1601]